MAAEGASDAMGPRYAPPDPTLPEPWKGLIDGSTGVMYYWNPETNITQYEKPTAVAPPMPSGPPPVPSAPKPASVSSARTEQPNGIPGQQTHQMYTTPEQQRPPQQGNNMPQSYPGVNMDQSQGYQYNHQPMHYMGYQPNMPQQRPPSDVNSNQGPPIGGPPGQATQYGSSQFSMQQPSPYGQLQQSGVEYQQHGPKFQNQMGQVHGQQPNVPPVGSNMGFEDNTPGRGGNDQYYNAKNGGPRPAMVPHQPKLAAIPMARTQPVNYCTSISELHVYFSNS